MAPRPETAPDTLGGYQSVFYLRIITRALSQPNMSSLPVDQVILRAPQGGGADLTVDVVQGATLS